MDDKKLESLVENIEIFLEGSANSNAKLLDEMKGMQESLTNSYRKESTKEAEILINAVQEFTLVTNELKKTNLSLKNAIEGFKPTVEVRQMTVDVKKPLFWILGAVFAIVICGVGMYHFIQKNSNLEAKNSQLRKAEMKYRYLKVATFINVKKFENTKELTEAMDGYYSKNAYEVDSTVYAREKQIREAFEAQEMARQQEAAAKQAIEEAKKLKQKADSLQKAQ